MLTSLNTELGSLATGDIRGVVQLLAAATTKQQGSADILLNFILLQVFLTLC